MPLHAVSKQGGRTYELVCITNLKQVVVNAECAGARVRHTSMRALCATGGSRRDRRVSIRRPANCTAAPAARRTCRCATAAPAAAAADAMAALPRCCGQEVLAHALGQLHLRFRPCWWFILSPALARVSRALAVMSCAPMHPQLHLHHLHATAASCCSYSCRLASSIRRCPVMSCTAATSALQCAHGPVAQLCSAAQQAAAKLPHVSQQLGQPGLLRPWRCGQV